MNSHPFTKHSFIRVKIHSRNILALALVDSGNLARTLMSEVLCKTLNLSMTESDIKLKSPTQTTIAVVGEIRDFKFFIENVPASVSVERALVVRNLAYPLNLGRSFLQQERARLDFSGGPGYVVIQEVHVPFSTSTINLLQPSVDYRFRRAQDYLRMRGIPGNIFIASPNQSELVNQVSSLNTVEPKANARLITVQRAGAKPVTLTLTQEGCVRADTPPRPATVQERVEYLVSKHAVYACQPTSLGPSSAALITVHAGPISLNDEEVYFVPDLSRVFFKGRSVIPLEGIYQTNNGSLHILVCNFGHEEVKMPAGMRMGNIRVKDVSEWFEVHAVEHKPPEKLSRAELDERRKYIFEQLKLKDNAVLSESEKQEVVQIFSRSLTTEEMIGYTLCSKVIKYSLNLAIKYGKIRAIKYFDLFLEYIW